MCPLVFQGQEEVGFKPPPLIIVSQGYWGRGCILASLKKPFNHKGWGGGGAWQQGKDHSDTSERQWPALWLGENWVGLEPGHRGVGGCPAIPWGQSGDSILFSLYTLVAAQHPTQLMPSVERRQGASLLYSIPEVRVREKVGFQYWL